jgi:hypothetical protein
MFFPSFAHFAVTSSDAVEQTCTSWVGMQLARITGAQQLQIASPCHKKVCTWPL